MILGGHDTRTPAKTAHDVCERRVTLARVPRDPDEREPPVRTERSYAIQAQRTRPGVCRVTVRSVHKATVGELTFTEARAAGFANVDSAQAAWLEQTGRDTIDPAESVWHITFELDRHNEPRFLAAYSPIGYTSGPVGALKSESDDGQLLEAPSAVELDEFTRAARERMPVGAPRAKPPAEPGLVDRVEEALRIELRERFRGENPEDVAALSPKQGTPGDIRRRRRAMGLRAVDGLFPVPDDQVAELVESMASEGCSVRDVALALDCSVGKAQGLISRHREAEAA